MNISHPPLWVGDIENVILGGDFNLNLDTISTCNCQEAKIFNEILSFCNLIDGKIYGTLPDDKEIKTIKSRGLDVIQTKEACTYIPSITNQKSNRLDAEVEFVHAVSAGGSVKFLPAE